MHHHLFLLACWLASSSNAFIVRTATQQKNNCRLGPVARNGLEYQDITVGTGRRILKGDTVYCYYTGSFVKSNIFGVGTPTVFDEIMPTDDDDMPPFAFPVGKGQVIPGWEMGVMGKVREVLLLIGTVSIVGDCVFAYPTCTIAPTI